MHPGNDTALIVIDVQNDFLPGGALAVPNGDDIIEPINTLARHFSHVVITQDWHPESHISFASAHSRKAPFETIELPYGSQILWPDHCVQGSEGAQLAAGLHIPHAGLILRKGMHLTTDSYSAFTEADGITRTGLAGYLRERGIRRVFCVGLATDFCVSWTALDAKAAGFETVIIETACRAIDTGGSLDAARLRWRESGVETSQHY